MHVLYLIFLWTSRIILFHFWTAWLCEILEMIIVIDRWKILHWVDYDRWHTKSASRYSKEETGRPMWLGKYSTNGTNGCKLCEVCLLDVVCFNEAADACCSDLSACLSVCLSVKTIIHHSQLLWTIAKCWISKKWCSESHRLLWHEIIYGLSDSAITDGFRGLLV